MKIIHLMGGGDIGGAKTHIMTIAKELSKTNDLKLISFREGEFPEEAKAAGIDVSVIATKNLFKASAQLLKIVSEIKPDIVHSHGAKANMMAAILKWQIKIPVITTVHSDYKLDYLENKYKQLVFGGINAISLKKLDFFQPVSNTMAKSLISRGFNPQSIYRVYNGMNFETKLENFDRAEYLNKTYNIKTNENDILCAVAARLTAVKDIHTAIKGFASAAKENENLKFLIAGIGEDEESLKKLALELNVSDRVYFCGWVTEVEEFFLCVDINILSSLSEGFPYSILEGAKGKCASISTDVGGLKEFIENGFNGILFKPKDTQALTNAILKLSKDKEMRESFAQRLYDKASQTYSTNAVCEKQMQNYKLALDAYKERKNKRSGVVICGAYGKGNSGDEAILSAIHTELNQINPAMSTYVLSRMPQETRLSHRLGAIYTFNIFAMIKRFLKAKVYINGGGSLIQDVTSTRSLYYYLFTIVLAKILGCKVMMYGCGIGPVSLPKNRKLAARIINKYVDVITLRDGTSADELLLMGVTSPEIILSGDPTLIIKEASPEKRDIALTELGIDPSLNYIGFGLRRWESFDSVSDEIAKSAEYAYKKHGLIPLFIPIEHPNDVLTAQKVSQKLSCPYASIENRLPIELTIAILAKMKTVVGIRLHSLMFSAGRGVPVIGLSYDVKVDGFLKYIEAETCLELSSVKAEEICKVIDLCVSGKLDEKVLSAAKKLTEREKENVKVLKRLLNERKD